MKKKFTKKLMVSFLSTLLAGGTLFAYFPQTVKAETLIQHESIHSSSQANSMALEKEIPLQPKWAISKKYTVTANSVNIRTGPGTKYDSVGKLYKKTLFV